MTLLRSSVPIQRSVRDRDYVWKSNLGDISHVIERKPTLSTHEFKRAHAMYEENHLANVII